MSGTRNWIRTCEYEGGYLESVNGVRWADALLPARVHRCEPQTRGRIKGDYIERCACGAARLSPSGSWSWRNERRRAA